MILCIIPARGGSKGVPGKNFKTIAGKPLIGWTIESAKKSKLIDEIVVSSDSLEILRYSHSLGVNVDKRPSHLSTDDSLIIETLKYLLEKFPTTVIVVLLQPTSPIRNDNLIDRCIGKYLDKKTKVLVTGFDCYFKPYNTYYQRRQDIDTFFYNDGNVHILTADMIRNGRINSSDYCTVKTTREENIEIDDKFDFWLAEQILKKRKDG